ncbi:MAG: hypothetical protein ACREB8_09510 [Pseudolabrys sp.]
MTTIHKYVPFALLLMLGATLLFAPADTAKANLGPVGPRTAATAPDDTTAPDNLAIATGADGTALEQDYFRAPVSDRAAGPALPCRLQMHIFDKTRLAQWCH